MGHRAQDDPVLNGIYLLGNRPSSPTSAEGWQMWGTSNTHLQAEYSTPSATMIGYPLLLRFTTVLTGDGWAAPGPR